MVDRLVAPPGPDDSVPEPGPEEGTAADRFLRDLEAARAGDIQALGQAMEPFRQFLLLVAERELGRT